MVQIVSSGSERINAIDALRGIAVLLMIEQHLGIWLWKQSYRLFQDPFMLCFNGLGGLAAPLFIVLAGFGASLLPLRHASPASALMLRGLAILLFGYMLNLLTPSWFSPGSWYVLHMIGFSLILSPLLLKCSPRSLLTVFAAVLIATVCSQHYLQTPFPLSTGRMKNTNLPGGMFRLALAEGHFPVFPWFAFFIAGFLAGTWRSQGGNKNIAYLAASCLCAGLIFAAAGFFRFPFATSGVMLRACKLLPRFYPAFLPLTLMLIGAALFSVFVCTVIVKRATVKSINPFVCLGRVSMTLLISHVIIVHEGGPLLGFWQIFSKTQTLALIAAVLLLVSYLAVQWNKIDFKYSTEWLMRKGVGLALRSLKISGDIPRTE